MFVLFIIMARDVPTGRRERDGIEDGVESAVKASGRTRGGEARLESHEHTAFPKKMLPLRLVMLNSRSQGSQKGSLHIASCCYPKQPGSGTLGLAARGQRGCCAQRQYLENIQCNTEVVLVPLVCSKGPGDAELSSQACARKDRAVQQRLAVLVMRTQVDPLHTAHGCPQGRDSDPTGAATVNRGGLVEKTRGEEKGYASQAAGQTDKRGSGDMVSGQAQAWGNTSSRQTFLPRGPVLPRSPGTPEVPPLPWSMRRGESQ